MPRKDKISLNEAGVPALVAQAVTEAGVPIVTAPTAPVYVSRYAVNVAGIASARPNFINEAGLPPAT